MANGTFYHDGSGWKPTHSRPPLRRPNGAPSSGGGTDSGENASNLKYYSEQDGGGMIANGVNPDNEIWKDFNARLAFGMDTSKAPVPFRVKGQMLVDGTVIARNVAAHTNDLVNNRWGMHMFEGYATDDYSRFTILADKHTHDGLKMVEVYYYTGAGHSAADYGWVKIGSDVCHHSFDFRRDIMRAHGMIDCRMPITLARISLTNDIDTTYETVEEVDAKYEGEGNWQQNLRCLKYVYLKNAENGAMFYDTDIDKPVIKVGGDWHVLETSKIEDARYLVLGQSFEARPCTSLALSETELHFTAANSQTLAATTVPVDTTDTLTWESSNEAVAIVNKNGVVTATGNGGCIITAKCGDQSATCSVSVAFEDNLPDENLTIKFTANGWNGTGGAWVADIPEGAVNTAGKYNPGEGYSFETGSASSGNKAAVGANFSGDYTIVSRQLFTQEYFDANVASDVYLFRLHAEGATDLATNPRVDVATVNSGKATYRAYNADGSAAANLWRSIPAFTPGAPVAVNWAFVHERSGAWRLYADGNLIKSGMDSVTMPDVAMELWMPGVLSGVYTSHPYVKHQVFLAYNIAKTDEEVRAVHTALYELFSGEAAAMYPLENGEYGSLTTVAVTNGNHVYATTTDTEEKYANISHVSANSNWSLSALAQPKWFALKAGQTATLRLTNIVNDSGASFSVAFKAAESTTSTALKITEIKDASNKEVAVTVDEDTDIGCLMMYFQNPGSAIEFDVELVVDGLKYI